MILYSVHSYVNNIKRFEQKANSFKDLIEKNCRNIDCMHLGKFNKARLNNGDYRRGVFSVGSYIETDLSNSIMHRAVLSGSNFTNANLSNCDLTKSVARYTRFNNANLSKTDFNGAVLIGSDFRGCDLTNTSFIGADLRNCLFDITLFDTELFADARISIDNEQKWYDIFYGPRFRLWITNGLLIGNHGSISFLLSEMREHYRDFSRPFLYTDELLEYKDYGYIINCVEVSEHFGI